MKRDFLHGARELLDLAWPTLCVACGTPGNEVCRACLTSLTPSGPRRLQRQELGPQSLTVVATLNYDATVSAILSHFKDEGRLKLKRFLVPFARDAIYRAISEQRAAERRWVVVPAPSRRSATRERGRFPLGELAQAASPVPVARLLELGPRAKDQVGLSREARGRNLNGAVRLRRSQKKLVEQLLAAGWGVVLFDDVVTSGATLLASAQALCAAGFTDIAAATIANADALSRGRVGR